MRIIWPGYPGQIVYIVVQCVDIQYFEYVSPKVGIAIAISGTDKDQIIFIRINVLGE